MLPIFIGKYTLLCGGICQIGALFLLSFPLSPFLGNNQLGGSREAALFCLKWKWNFVPLKKAISLPVVSSQQNQSIYLSEILQQYSATRFHQKSAAKLASILAAANIFHDGQVLLLSGLSHEDDAIQTRDKLIENCPIFGLKSASDFMVSIGLSRDVLALDTRVVGVFQKYFDYNLTPGQVQSNRSVYFSLESALREFCQQEQVSLALLDRLLFNYSNLSIIELVVKYPELLR